ncbi:MBL fold metallo-hydrolase [Deinococcus peraridilitoris]|nr:MBL fold metallo-hydrolase [Deinococcus peraridilitoris]
MLEVCPGVYRHTDSAHVYLIRDAENAVLINIGDGSALDHLPPGIEQVRAVLLTHHHRDVAAGAARAAAHGIAVYAPEGECGSLQGAPRLLNHADARNNYDGRPRVWSVPQAIHARALRDYRTYHFGSLSVGVRPTPGVTPGAVSLLYQGPDFSAAFTGDLLFAPGQTARLTASQWSYNGGEGLAASVLSLLDLADQELTHVLPAHGDVMNAEALSVTAEALWPLLQLRRHNPRLLQLREQPYQELRPWLLMNRTSLANAYVLRSRSGRALMIDFGYDFCFGQAGSTEREARRPWLYTIPSLLRKYGVTGIDAVIPTHYHDDHVAGIGLLRETYGAQLWTAENITDVLARPEDYRLPCLWFEGMSSDRTLRLGESVAWQEFRITPHELTGHARYACALLVEGYGERVLFGGDQYSDADGLGLNYTYPNLFREDDYLRSAHLYTQLQPDLVLSGHAGPLVPSGAYLEALLARGAALQALHASLQPLVSRLLMRVEPIRAPSGSTITLTIENPTGKAFQGELRVQEANKTPACLRVDLSAKSAQTWDFCLTADEGTRVHFELRGQPGEPAQYTHASIGNEGPSA